MEDHYTEPTNADRSRHEYINTIELLLITRAYNRKEISLDEWLKRSKEWAEGMIRQYGQLEGIAGD